MKRRLYSFNIYFALACLTLAGGCAVYKSTKEAINPKKEQSTIRLYMEGPKADTLTSESVLVTREKFPYTIDREPFLTEADLDQASLVNDPAGDGGYFIKLTFNQHGSMVLNLYTADNKGRHIIIYSQFPMPGAKHAKAKKVRSTNDADLFEPSTPAAVQVPDSSPGKPRQSAWLAAVLVRQPIENGVFRFTPDASREEGIRIVRGLRNVLAKQKNSGG